MGLQASLALVTEIELLEIEHTRKSIELTSGINGSRTLGGIRDVSTLL
jgi:hypothetical protein